MPGSNIVTGPTLLFRCVLTGWGLTVSQSKIYQCVKSAVLQADEFMPENDCQPSGNMRKTEDQTHMEFVWDEVVISVDGVKPKPLKNWAI